MTTNAERFIKGPLWQADECEGRAAPAAGGIDTPGAGRLDSTEIGVYESSSASEKAQVRAAFTARKHHRRKGGREEREGHSP